MHNSEKPDDPEIVQISPCDGWVFRHQNDHQKDSIYPVAAWALLRSGRVVGLIPASTSKDERDRAALVLPPPLGGTYERLSKSAEEVAND